MFEADIAVPAWLRPTGFGDRIGGSRHGHL